MKKGRSEKAAAAPSEPPDTRVKRNPVSQGQIPRRTLRDALTVAQAITDNYAGQPAAPHQVALALGASPTSSTWRELTGAAVAYGLTRGAFNADRISLEPLGRRATAPTEEGDDLRARVEAAIKPKVLREFFQKYNRNKFPPELIAKNVLQQELGVPADRCDAALRIIKDNGQFVGFIRETKTGPFVAIEDPQPGPVRIPLEPEGPEEASSDGAAPGEAAQDAPPAAPASIAAAASVMTLRVFISHSRNTAIVEQVKQILDLYDIEYEIAVEEETGAIPVPEKVMAAMRRCQAGVMIVTADEQNRTSDGFGINNNVLIEIGAAFVLYDQRVLLLWDRRLRVPSNLQGLYRCEFEGSEISFAVGTKLAKALKGFRG